MNKKINIQDIKPLIDLIQSKHQLLTNNGEDTQSHKQYSLEEYLEISEKLAAGVNALEIKLEGKK